MGMAVNTAPGNIASRIEAIGWGLLLLMKRFSLSSLACPTARGWRGSASS